MTLLAAEQITVTRGARAILRTVSLQAVAGEFIAVLGPNGAGKSTLLSVLAGLLKPDAGQVLLDSKPLVHLPSLQLARRRAYLPQNPRLEWPLTVERLVALGLSPRLPATGGLPQSYAPAITRALALCDLTSRRDQVATTLSGGEFARAMLARAIVGGPEILIVDEPITGLDPKHAMQCMQLLKDFARGGTLVIAALHDLTLAARYARRAIVVVDGALVFDADSLTEEIIHSAFGVRALAVGAGDSRGFTLLSPSEK
jgi:iron complex transport system ATP-binding protein